ncbi:MAG: hypothetical protein ACD_15C00133G0004 [uncultured bacterium]|nr:MAG: hypothetical protein ACD_15C00133G0004 [uncultured bacterium]HBD05047.1 hypothetical protein [Candidatus Uhrbacteria bacterium]
MGKNKKTYSLVTAITIASLFFVETENFSLAASNPNYGTTTFFSSKNEKPVLEKPILGAGKPSNNNHDDEDDDDGDDNAGIVVPDDIFDKIGDTINSVLDGSAGAFNETKKSLFDFQSDFDSNRSSDGEFSGEDEFFIAGPRGESPEYMASLNKDNENRTVEFNFEDSSLKVAPKKSKLLFTNKEVAIDMTSQYVSVAIIFIISVGSAVGYYMLKKEELKGKKEDYD